MKAPGQPEGGLTAGRWRFLVSAVMLSGQGVFWNSGVLPTYQA